MRRLGLCNATTDAYEPGTRAKLDECCRSRTAHGGTAGSDSRTAFDLRASLRPCEQGWPVGRGLTLNHFELPTPQRILLRSPFLPATRMDNGQKAAAAKPLSRARCRRRELRQQGFYGVRVRVSQDADGGHAPSDAPIPSAVRAVPGGANAFQSWRNARSVGAQRQLFDLLCHAIRTNLIAQHLYGHQANARAPAA
jgi:hypothetical protein